MNRKKYERSRMYNIYQNRHRFNLIGTVHLVDLAEVIIAAKSVHQVINRSPSLQFEGLLITLLIT